MLKISNAFTTFRNNFQVEPAELCQAAAIALLLPEVLTGIPAYAGNNTSGAHAQRQLEEVVVVAQRREESAQLIPISINSFDSDALDTLGISNIADIRAQVPNFIVDPFPASNQTLRLFIRGIGIADVQITQDPAVGVYLDGVYLARSTGLAAEVADLKRIEVLRGPQGTLYGRNTTGGALNLVTARPDAAGIGFTQDLGAGNRDRLNVRTTVNLPLGEASAVKLAALFQQQDGFIDNDGPGGDFGDREGKAYRLDWRWQPDRAFTLDYAWDKSRLESFNYTPQAVAPREPGGTPADEAILSSRRFVPYGEGRFSHLQTSVSLLPNNTDIEGHTLTLEWLLQDLTIKSISGWRELTDLSYVDFASGATGEYRVDFQQITIGRDGDTVQDFEAVRTSLEQDQFSQELQAFGSLSSGLDYVAGLYYFRESARESWFPLHHISSFPALATGDQADAVTLRGEDNAIENEAVALYGQLTWSPNILDSRLHISLGWRHSEDERAVNRTFQQRTYLDFGDDVLGPLQPVDFVAAASRNFDDDSFSLIVEYDRTDEFHLYGKYVEAYKSGGFNIRDPDPAFFSRGFDAEKNHTVELGFKGEWRRRQVRINSALFYSDFNDLQLNILLPEGISDTRVFNSGSATLSGFEVELLAFPWYGLLTGVNYAYLHSDIDSIVDPFTGLNRSFEFTNAPRHSATLNIDYTFPPVFPGELSINVNYNYVDDREPGSQNLHRDEYQLLNGRLALSDIPLPTGLLSISAWVKNALDAEYVDFAVDNLPHASRAVLWGETRTWGLDLRYEY